MAVETMTYYYAQQLIRMCPSVSRITTFDPRPDTQKVVVERLCK